MRYAERNPLRARLVRSAAKWRFSSLGRASLGLPGPPLDAGPVTRPANWLAWVDEPQTEAELASLRRSVIRGVPFGGEAWQKRTVKRLGLNRRSSPWGGRRRKRRKNNDSRPLFRISLTAHSAASLIIDFVTAGSHCFSTGRSTQFAFIFLVVKSGIRMAL